MRPRDCHGYRTKDLFETAGRGVDATFVELQSRYGHYATTEEPEKWVPRAEKFLNQLAV